MNLRPFEISLLVFFGILALLAVLLLSTFEPEPDDGQVSLIGGSVTVWGTLPYEAFMAARLEIVKTMPDFNRVNYIYVEPERFDEAFVNALADQSSPDLILVSHEKLVRHRSRIQLYPYESFPERDFRNLYIEGAEIFMLPQGIFGFPVAIDPLMMYYNRNILANHGFLVAPKTWEEIVGDVVPRITTRDFNRAIQRSALAMGEYGNIRNAFGIISALALQGGSAGVTPGINSYRIRLNESVIPNHSRVEPFTNAISFFTNFNTVQNTLYSWNRALPQDREMFLREDLALYFGYGSEGVEIAARNPNLNFDIAELPQSAAANVRRTYGKFYALAMPIQAPNRSGAFQVMQQFWNSQYAATLATASNMSPAHRSAVMAGSNDIFGRVYFAASPTARAWLNPDRREVDQIFTRMLDDVSANRTDVPGAVNDALGRLRSAYQ